MSTFEKMTGVNPEECKKHRPIRPQGWYDEYWFTLDFSHQVAIGENEAHISGVDYSGEYFLLYVDGESDSVKITYFSDELIHRVGKAIKDQCNLPE